MKKNRNIKIIIGIVIGVILSGVTSYAVAKTLIDSKDVIYTDTYDLKANNVQEAIDGTCSKIDTRLSEIENQLYTLKNISGSKVVPITTNFAYTGVSITLPAKSYCSIIVRQIHKDALPNQLTLSKDDSHSNRTMVEAANGNKMLPAGNLGVALNEYTENAKTYYVWASAHINSQINEIEWQGFCATKYKQ